MSSQEIGSRSVPLSNPQLAAIALACRQHRVARLHAFGSLLRPDYRPGESDIELLVEFLSASRLTWQRPTSDWSTSSMNSSVQPWIW